MMTYVIFADQIQLQDDTQIETGDVIQQTQQEQKPDSLLEAINKEEEMKSSKKFDDMSEQLNPDQNEQNSEPVQVQQNVETNQAEQNIEPVQVQQNQIEEIKEEEAKIDQLIQSIVSQKIIYGDTLSEIENLISDCINNQNTIIGITNTEMTTIGKSIDVTLTPVAQSLSIYYGNLGVKFNKETFSNLMKMIQFNLKKQMNEQYVDFENLKLKGKVFITPQHRINLFNIIITKLLTAKVVSQQYANMENKDDQTNLINVLMDQKSKNNIAKVTFFDKLKSDYGYDSTLDDKQQVFANLTQKEFLTKIDKLLEIYTISSQKFACPAELIFNKHVDAKNNLTANAIKLLKGNKQELALLMIGFIYERYPNELTKFLSSNDSGINANEQFLENELNFILENTKLFQEYITNAKLRNEDFGNSYNIQKLLSSKGKFCNMSVENLKNLIVNTKTALSEAYIKVMEEAGKNTSNAKLS